MAADISDRTGAGGRMQLPLKLTADLMQTRWKSLLDPILENPVNNVSLLDSITITAGQNVINHRLNRIPQGWFLIDVESAAMIYRNQEFNPTTLGLVCVFPSLLFSGDTTIGSPIISNVSSAQIVYLQENQLVNSLIGAPIPANSRIISVGTNSVTINQNATGATVANAFQAQQTTTNVSLGIF